MPNYTPEGRLALRDEAGTNLHKSLFYKKNPLSLDVLCIKCHSEERSDEESRGGAGYCTPLRDPSLRSG